MIDRLRRKLFPVPDAACSCSRRRTSAPAAGRAIPTTSSRCISTDLELLHEMGADRRQAAWSTVEGITDVSTDREPGGLQLNCR